MKKILLLFITSLLLAGLSYSQSLMLLNDNSEDITNTTVYASNLDGTKIIYHAKVKNTTSGALDIKVRKEFISGPNGASNYFCLDICYSDVVVLSNSITLEADAEQSFEGDYKPNSTTETTIVKYTFFTVDSKNVTEESTLIINYGVNASSINILDENYISNLYPNPAKNLVTIDYKINKPSYVIIRNILGSEIKKVMLNTFESTHTIDISELISGTYFYSFVTEDKIIKTKRLIIK